MGSLPFHVTLIGSGQVGCALAKAMRDRSIPHRLLALRQGLPTRLGPTRLILICVRDGQTAEVAATLCHTNLGSQTVVAHVSGVHGLEILNPLRPSCRGVAHLHPFCSIRSIGHPRHFAGAYFLGAGDASALPTVRRFVRLLGSRFVAGDRVNRRKYHLAAALLANGSVALMRSAAQLLSQSGIADSVGRKMLLDLARSVLFNAERLGFEAALTGPVRRGDVETIRQHLEELEDADDATRELYSCLVRLQIDIVRGLGELEPRVVRRLLRLVGP